MAAARRRSSETRSLFGPQHRANSGGRGGSQEPAVCSETLWSPDMFSLFGFSCSTGLEVKVLKVNRLGLQEKMVWG